MRTIKNFNDNWIFAKLPIALSYKEEEVCWEKVSLPHTYNAIDGTSGRTGICEGGEHYYRGLTCYQKDFSLEKKYIGKRIYLYFGAANTSAYVYLNGKPIGSHEGGYSAFCFEITDYISFDDKNHLSVEVSNAPSEYIAPITNQGDFTKMGGLYRDVKLIITEKTHISLTDFASSGVYITPHNVTNNNADIDIAIKTDIPGHVSSELSLIADIFDMYGKFVTSASGPVCAETHLMLVLSNPVLWNGIKNPYLYTARIRLVSPSEILDEVTETFGVRTYHMDSENGFFLNDEYLDLRGVNYHQDSFENGWAMTDEQRNRDYLMMQDMGCTAVRMAHYQHAPYEYDLCDKLGLLVWTELGIVNKMSPDDKAPVKVDVRFLPNAKRQLQELIRQNYNHPSIIVWGISNELYQMTDEIYSIYNELHRIAETEDPHRLKTFADSQFWGRFLGLPGDVVGYNRYFGWYKDAGPVEQFGAWLDTYHEKKEKRPLCVSEYGGGAAISQHKDNIDWETEIDPWGLRHYENYQSAMHEKIWAQFAERKYLWGKFIWCMFDFASDGREEGDTKGINDKGLVTRERIPKDSFFFYKSVWNPEPMVHITQKRYKNRPHVIPELKVYSNAQSVELFVGDSRIGVMKQDLLPDGYKTAFTWHNVNIKIDVENRITAVATFHDGSRLTDTTLWVGTKGDNN